MYSSQIYDPLGLLSPVTIRSKILIQQLWEENFEWDETVTENLSEKWTQLAKDIENATEFIFQRYYFSNTSTNTSPPTLHIFTDASLKAYGAVAYLSNGSETALVMAETRVVALKDLTLPHLERMGALTAERLADHLLSSLDIQQVVFWWDSCIVLHWLKTTKTLKRFIANLVKEIQNLTDSYEWRYCPTEINPADLLTRGITFEQFV